jgi:hypothetical protein
MASSGQSTFDVAPAAPATRKRLTMACSLKDIEEEYGLGMYLYFDFLRFMFVFNLVLLAVLLINWIPHVVRHHNPATDGLDIFFVSGYGAENHTLWAVTTTVAFGLALALGWVYPLRVRQVVRSRDTTGVSGQDLWELDSMNILPEQMGMIERNLRLSDWSRGLRMVVSYLLFALGMALCAAVMALLVFRQVWKVDLNTWIPDTRIYYYTPITWWDFAVAAMLTVLDFLGKRLAGWLTHLERHKRRLTHSKHKTFKLFVFKVVLVCTLYVARRVAANIYNQRRECPMRPEAIKFFTIVLSDLTIGNALTWAVPLTRKL